MEMEEGITIRLLVLLLIRHLRLRPITHRHPLLRLSITNLHPPLISSVHPHRHLQQVENLLLQDLPNPRPERFMHSSANKKAI
jgi:hypothetical protein